MRAVKTGAERAERGAIQGLKGSDGIVWA